MNNYFGSGQEFITYCQQLKRSYLRNKKVLLIQSPQFLLDTFNLEIAKKRGYYAYPPAGLQWIAKMLLRHKLEVKILDLNYEILKRAIYEGFDYRHWPQILDECLEHFMEPSIVGVTCLSVGIDIFSEGHPLTSVLRYFHQKDSSIVLAGGPIATNEYPSLLQEGLCHFVIEGEGENKINFLLDQLLEARQGVKRTPGIYFYSQGQVQQSCGGRDIVDLKGNLTDVYEYIPIEGYCLAGSLNPFSRMAGTDRRFAGIQLNRGCRGDCKFCGVTDFMGRGVRSFPVEDLIQEINFLVKEKGVRHLEILDDDFLGSPGQQKSVIQLLKEMVQINREHSISWSAGNGLIAASITEEILGLMRDSGCVGFRVGIESGSADMLKKMQKPASLEKIRSVARLLQDYPEMFVGGNFILGLLGEETFGEMLETFRFALEINLDWAAITTFQLTSKANAQRNKIAADSSIATDFIPAKDTKSGEIVSVGTESLSGLNVFSLPLNVVPTRHEIKRIWFVFNFLINYVFNKNLLPGGNVKKFVSWVEAINVVYPDNAYMPLFSGIGYVLLKRCDKAAERLRQVQNILANSPYWQERFGQFFLMELVEFFPSNEAEAFAILEQLGAKIRQRIPNLTEEEVHERV